MILVESTRNVINTEEVLKGTLIWAKHTTWDEGKAGVVKDVSEASITVLFLPPLQNVMNHFVITASELEAGEWAVRYSSDGLQTVISYGGEESGE